MEHLPDCPGAQTQSESGVLKPEEVHEYARACDPIILSEPMTFQLVLVARCTVGVMVKVISIM